MAARHGTRRRYNEGCRCDDCTVANAAYQQRYRQRRTVVVPLSAPVTPPSPGAVEAGVQVEIAELAQAWPGLAQTALALARTLDNPRVMTAKPAAARELVAILSTLDKRSERRAKLASVKSMTTSSPLA